MHEIGLHDFRQKVACMTDIKRKMSEKTFVFSSFSLTIFNAYLYMLFGYFFHIRVQTCQSTRTYILIFNFDILMDLAYSFTFLKH